MREVDKAYAAGFLDGEGCILLWKSKGLSYQLKITINQTYNDSPLWFLVKLWGGQIRIERKGKHKRWRITNQAAFLFLLDIQQYLMVKKSQAEVAIEYYQNRKLWRHELSDSEYVKKSLEYKIKLSKLKKLKVQRSLHAFREDLDKRKIY